MKGEKHVARHETAKHIEIPQAFPTCNVKLFKPEHEDQSDIYTVTAIKEGRMTLEALPGTLHNPPPESQSRLIVQSLAQEAGYRVPIRVIERKVNAEGRISVLVEQDGEIVRIERRARDRVAVRFSVEVDGLSSATGRPLSIFTVDANSLGARILSPVRLTAGQQIQLRLELLDGGQPLACAAQVVRCRHHASGQYDVGLRFLHLADSECERLKDAILRQMLQLGSKGA